VPVKLTVKLGVPFPHWALTKLGFSVSKTETKNKSLRCGREYFGFMVRALLTFTAGDTKKF